MPATGGPRLTIARRPDEVAAALRCEADVFGRWFGNSFELLAEEYRPYLPATVLISIHDDSAGEAVGMMRLIAPSEYGWKTLDDASRAPWSLTWDRLAEVGFARNRTWDVATLAVRPDVSGPVRLLAASALYHALVMIADVRSGGGWMLAILDEKVRGVLDAVGLSAPALPGCRPAPYLGSPSSVPVGTYMPSALQVQRQRNPEGYRLIALGQGLDPIVVPPRSHFLADSEADALRTAS